MLLENKQAQLNRGDVMDEVLVVPLCNCEPKEFIVAVTDYETGKRIKVIGYRDGTISNRYDDGTVGVPDHIRELADESEDWYCIDCFKETDMFVHEIVYVICVEEIYEKKFDKYKACPKEESMVMAKGSIDDEHCGVVVWKDEKSAKKRLEATKRILEAISGEKMTEYYVCGIVASWSGDTAVDEGGFFRRLKVDAQMFQLY